MRVHVSRLYNSPVAQAALLLLVLSWMAPTIAERDRRLGGLFPDGNNPVG